MDRAAAISAFFARLDRACIEQPRQDLAFDPPLKRIARLEARAPIHMALARQALQEKIAADKAAQVARVAKMEAERRADRQEGKPDLGPLVRRRRGEIEQEERPDIDSDAEYKPTITGSRRADPLRALLGIRNLRKPHDGAEAENARRWIAAQTYRNALEIASGARIGDRPVERVDRSIAMYGPNDRILDCTRLVADAKTAVGKNYPALRWCVEEYSGIDEFAVVAAVSHAAANEMLLAALDALVTRFEQYDGPAAR